MTTKRARKQLIRQWRLIETLHAHRRGLTVAALRDRLGTSRSTLYRDLRVLYDAGVPLERERINGEIRHRLVGPRLPSLGADLSQRAAAGLARQLLDALRGSSWVEALEALDPIDEGIVDVSARGPAPDAQIVARVESAIRRGRCVKLLHRGRRDDEASWRTVEPRQLLHRDGQPYLHAYCLDRDAWRTFKLLRIERAEPSPFAVDPDRVVPDEAHPHAVRVWDGAPIEVTVRLSPDAARLAPEWPLVADQHLEPTPDGSVVVRATVAGLVETKRWVLGWGAAAHVLEPAELRDAVRDELVGALSHYAKPGPVRRAPRHADERAVPEDVRHP
ncbi:MAG TPA: WYL domain-containing protein [Sandaracinaceae bacterium LLY-WYZ-13_1]|nr:WYL domain-containing protein [Sandaracinaceae bacterium LLY-WYZ-13_1]